MRRFRGRPDRTATWDGQRERGPGAHRAGARGRLRLHRRRARQGGEHHRGPAARCRGAPVARPGTGVSVRDFTLRGPLSAVPAGAFAHFEVGPVDRSFDFVLSRLGDPEPLRRGGRVGGRFRIRVPDDMRTGVYVVRVQARATSAPSGRSPWPGCRRGAPVARRARWWCFRRSPGRGSTAWTTTPTASRTGCRSRDAVRLDRPFAGGGAADALRGGGVAAAALARPRAAPIRPHHGHRAGPPRGPGARQRARGRLRRQRAVAARRAAAAAARLRGRRRPRRRVRRGLLQARGAAARRAWRATPTPPRRENALGERTELIAHERGAAHRVRGRPRPVRGRVRVPRRVHGLRGAPPACRARRAA